MRLRLGIQASDVASCQRSLEVTRQRTGILSSTLVQRSFSAHGERYRLIRSGVSRQG